MGDKASRDILGAHNYASRSCAFHKLGMNNGLDPNRTGLKTRNLKFLNYFDRKLDRFKVCGFRFRYARPGLKPGFDSWTELELFLDHLLGFI